MFIVEGNIGAGKSTFLKLMRTYLPHITPVFEPLKTWHTPLNGESLLANFYQEPQKWAYTIETLTLISRVQEHLKEQQETNPLRLIERSIYSGYYCFAKNSYISKFLTSLEWELYVSWYNFLTQNKCVTPRGIIYLKVEPEITYERIKKRRRLGESEISLSYLTQIHQRHEEYLIKKQVIDPALAKVPILTLDCTNEFEHNSAQTQLFAQQLEEFIYDIILEAPPAIFHRAIRSYTQKEQLDIL